ncbi:MAG TPA: polysaccharide deacetylase family protein [Reyranella sp.]|jgi:peptidoglycan/xylan/chitin deacetylase (PgdA/CDA1 family)|nr:polysaccharide deacetylase family protein [Reyranella sp.]
MTTDACLPSGWPKDRPLAISVSVMLEGWADDAAPGIGPMGNPLKSGVLDRQARSWAEYGPKVGAWRLLGILAEQKARAVFYVSGIVAERHGELMRAIGNAGHVVAAHGWSQHLIPAYQSDDEESRDLKRCVSVLEQSSGKRVAGWLSPRCTPSARTSGLLAEAGFDWHADFFDDDLPSRRDTGSGPIIAVPFTMEVNDMPLYVRYGSEPEAFTRTFERIVSHWPQLGRRPGCLDITVHAHVFGRPMGAIEFAKSLEVARRYGARSWLTDHCALAELYRNEPVTP